MDGKKILISPLNWGFGHAGRMLALALALRRKGHKVIFGVDKSLIPLIENEMPGTEFISIPGMRIRYSRFLPQYLCVILQLPGIIASSIREHYTLRRVAASLGPDIIISDSRFGLFHKEIVSVYITHQLRIAFPRSLRFLEPLGVWLHRKIIRNYDLCLIPDYPGPENLSGRLSHQLPLPSNAHYMGPLSRFLRTAREADDTFYTGSISKFPVKEPADSNEFIPDRPYCCLVLSGPEPQRSLLLLKVMAAVKDLPLVILTVTPLPPGTDVARDVTVITGPDTPAMLSLVTGSAMVIARAGYSSVMELASLGKGAVLIPTPGQTEQEYLGRHLNGRHGFVTVRQNELEREVSNHMKAVSESINQPATLFERINPMASGHESNTALPDSSPLLEKALSLLLQHNKK